MRPKFAAALDWSLSPLFRTGRADVAATLLGGLTDGQLASVGNFPGVVAARSRSLERARNKLGDQTDGQLAHGAAMTNDELAEHAITHLDPG